MPNEGVKVYYDRLDVLSGTEYAIDYDVPEGQYWVFSPPLGPTYTYRDSWHSTRLNPRKTTFKVNGQFIFNGERCRKFVLDLLDNLPFGPGSSMTAPDGSLRKDQGEGTLVIVSRLSSVQSHGNILPASSPELYEVGAFCCASLDFTLTFRATDVPPIWADREPIRFNRNSHLSLWDRLLDNDF